MGGKMQDRELAQSIFREFRVKPESGFIASEFSLYHLAKFLSTTPVSSVLEVGAGIGTITKLLLSHVSRPARITSTEEVPICISELTKNIASCGKSGWRLVNGIADIEKDASFDLVIFDGILDPKLQYSFFKQGTWCFVEGNRKGTRIDLYDFLSKSGLTINMQSYYPGGYKLRVTPGKRFLGMTFPKLQFKIRKGCHIGQVVALN